jgi:hypothetical protein
MTAVISPRSWRITHHRFRDCATLAQIDLIAAKWRKLAELNSLRVIVFTPDASSEN